MSSNFSMRLIAASEIRVLAALLCVVSVAQAHDVSRSDSKITIEGREVHVTLTLNVTELRHPARSVYDVVREHYFLSSPVAPESIKLESETPIGGPLDQLKILYVFAQDVTKLEVRSTLYQVMPADHQHMMNVRLNGNVHQAILDSRTEQASFSGAQATKLQTLWRFTRLGVEHIFTGYDHLAFLLGLLVATATLGSLVRIITSFTIAHSITLALATFNVVLLPTRLTESLIAVSIAYVAAENLLDFRIMKRYYITFFFGLIHGFGFSNVLREMDLPKPSLALSLFSFNAGVEIGQITFVLLIFPLVQDLVSSGWKRLKPAVSVGVACLAVYWFVQRAFLG
jgi:hypothetical protein